MARSPRTLTQDKERSRVNHVCGRAVLAVLGWILISTAGAGVLEAVKVVVFRREEKRGALAGWWWQITYPPTDPQMAGIPWSVELVSVRHFKRRVTAVMFRVLNRDDRPDADYEKRWRGEGRYDDIVLDGHHWGEAGHAGHGTFHLWRCSATELRGEFSESTSQSTGMSMTLVWDGAPLRWVRLRSTEEAPVLKMLRDCPPPEDADAYSRSVHKELARAVPGHPVPPSRLRVGAAHAGALTDLTPAYALEAERQRAARRSQRGSAGNGDSATE